MTSLTPGSAFADLLETLNYSSGEHISINWQAPAAGPDDNPPFRTQVVEHQAAAELAATKTDHSNVWFGVNPVSPTATGRGTASQVTRLAAVWADLDVKPGGCPDWATAEAIITALAELLGAAPSAVINSGNGLQPYWPIEPTDGGPLDAEEKQGRAAALLRRWGRLVKLVAENHGAQADSVFDLPRVLRVPGTYNRKAEPLPVTIEHRPGGPITVDALDELLDNLGVAEHDTDRRTSPAEPVSNPEGWAYADTPCNEYVAPMVKGWATDNPTARHPWLMAQAVRIACAHRNGCLTAQQHRDAIEALARRMHEVCEQGIGGQARKVKRFEVADALAAGAAIAATKTDDEVLAELGGALAHLHNYPTRKTQAMQPDTATEGPRSERNTDDDGLPRIYKATDLRPAKQPEWIGRGWLPRAATTILIGDEGIGKSLAWVIIAAAITTGRACEAFNIPARDPGVVVIVVTEDDWSTTVLPRLIVAGADLEHIRVICVDDDGSGAPMFPNHMSVLDDLDTDPALVVVDAWLDTVPRDLSVRDTQSARQALHPWKEFSTRTGAAVLLLTHTNRVSTGNSRDKYGATIALRQKARMTLYAQRADEIGNLLIGPDKANSTAAVPAAEFTIESVQHFEPTIDDDGTVGRLKYVGRSDKTAAEHLADKHEEQAAGEPRSAGEFARDWIKEYLSEEGPKADGQAAKKAAAAAGIKERTLQRACQSVGVVYTPTGVGKDYRVNWSLPDQIDDTGQQTSGSDGDTRAKPDANGSVQLGASGASGIGAGQEPTPARAKKESGASVAQVRDQDKQVLAPARQQKDHAPVGAPTAHTPGMTDRVQQILAKSTVTPFDVVPTNTDK